MYTLCGTDLILPEVPQDKRENKIHTHVYNTHTHSHKNKRKKNQRITCRKISYNMIVPDSLCFHLSI